MRLLKEKLIKEKHLYQCYKTIIGYVPDLKRISVNFTKKMKKERILWLS
jgi:hypothetical protein